MNVKERLKAFIAFLNISEREFCRAIGVSATYVQSLGNRINRSTLNAMQRAYPLLNTEWLLNGSGEMLLDPRMSEKMPLASEAPKNFDNDMAGRLLALVESQQKTIAEQAATISRQAATIEKLAEGSKKVAVEAPGILAPAGVD